MAYSQAHTQMETRALIQRHPAVLAAVAGGIPSLIGTRNGIGLSWDSADYIAVGLSMAADRGALDVTGQPMVIRPPGLSSLVTVGDWLSLSPDLVLRFVNSLSMMFLIWATHRLLVRAGTTTRMTWVGVGLVAVSPSLLDVFTMAWSEPPFVALTLAALLLATRERTWPWEFVMVAVFTTLFFVRYVGPFFAAPIALTAAVVQMRRSGLLLAMLRSGSVLGLSLVLPWLWLMRNKELSGYLTGYREPGGGTLLDPLKTFTGTLGSWLIARPPLQGNGGIYLNWNDFSTYMKVGGVAFWVMLTLLVAVFYATKPHVAGAVTVVSACIAVIVFYGGFSIYRFVYSELGPLDSRMMIGLYVPFIVVLVVTTQHLAHQLPQRVRRPGAILGSACVAGVLIVHGSTLARDTSRFGETSRHWGSVAFQTAPIHQFITSLPEDAALYSNEPQSLFAATFRWPIRNQYQYDRPILVPCTDRYFVWFNQTFLPDNKPIGADVVYEDSWGQVLYLDSCKTDLARFWP